MAAKDMDSSGRAGLGKQWLGRQATDGIAPEARGQAGSDRRGASWSGTVWQAGRGLVACGRQGRGMARQDRVGDDR